MEQIVFTRLEVPEPTCVAAGSIEAEGRFNGARGWTVRVIVSDLGTEPDRARVELYDPSGLEVYDSEDSGDFPMEGPCLGPHKHYMDSGNVKVRIWP